MNDDDLTPDARADLASAYLDGDMPAEERAQVDASAELTGLVQSFREVREQLADVAPAAQDVREAAFAAALAEFDQLDTPAAASAPVVSLAGRRRWPNVVMKAAAAVALVGVAGVAVLNRGGSDDKSSSKEDTMADMSAADTTMMAESAGGSPTSTIGSINQGGVDVAVVINSPDELLMLAPPGPVAADTTVSPDDGDNGGGETMPEMEAPRSAREAITCLTEDQQFLADIYYQSQFAIAALDTVSGVITAIADDCSVLASVGS